MTDEDRDPFDEAEKSPAMSWKDVPIGTVQTIDVSEPCRSVQQRDYDTGEPDFWRESDGSKGKPKMAAVFNGVTPDGEPISLWCPIPSDAFSKVGAAQKALGRRIGTGPNIDRIHVKLTGRPPAKNPKYTKNVVDVKIVDGGPKVAAAQPADDPFGDDAPPF